MPIGFTMESFGPDVEGAYSRLFPEDAAAKRRIERWRFSDNPQGPALFATARDEDTGGRIVGMIGFVPTRLVSKGSPIASIQAIDAVVDPDYRRRGIFEALGATIHSQAPADLSLVWGFPNASAAGGWFGKLGWRRRGTAPFMVRPLRTGFLLGRLWRPLRRLDLPLCRTGRVTNPSYVQVTRFDERFSALWRSFSAAVPCAVDRDAAWLQWRLFDKPGAAYRVTADEGDDGVPRAFVATCIEDKHGARICYVMEALCEPGAEARLTALLRHELARAAGEGADVALCWCPANGPNRPAHRQAGFHHFLDRLRPITIHFGGRSLPHAAHPGLIEDADWYISYLDSDTV